MNKVFIAVNQGDSQQDLIQTESTVDFCSMFHRIGKQTKLNNFVIILGAFFC